MRSKEDVRAEIKKTKIDITTLLQEREYEELKRQQTALTGKISELEARKFMGNCDRPKLAELKSAKKAIKEIKEKLTSIVHAHKHLSAGLKKLKIELKNLKTSEPKPIQANMNNDDIQSDLDLEDNPTQLPNFEPNLAGRSQSASSNEFDKSVCEDPLSGIAAQSTAHYTEPRYVAPPVQREQPVLPPPIAKPLVRPSTPARGGIHTDEFRASVRTSSLFAERVLLGRNAAQQVTALPKLGSGNN